MNVSACASVEEAKPMNSGSGGLASSLGGATAGAKSSAGGSTFGGAFATGGAFVQGGSITSAGALATGGSTVAIGGAAGTSGAAGGTLAKGGSSGASSGGTSVAGSTAKGGSASGGAAGSGGASGAAGAIAKGGAGGTLAGGAGGAGGNASCPGFAFCDDFQDGNMTANPAWIATPSAFSVVDDEATKVLKQEPMEAWAYGGVATWTDVTIQARIKVLNFGGTSSSNCAGLVARWQGSSTPNYLVAVCANGSVGVYKDGDLVDETNGTKAAGIVANTWYALKLKVSGAPGAVTLAVSVNDAPTFTITDTDTSNPVASGYVAVGSEKSVSLAFDDIKVSVP